MAVVLLALLETELLVVVLLTFVSVVTHLTTVLSLPVVAVVAVGHTLKAVTAVDLQVKTEPSSTTMV
jgi:hypothetical protein